jgi:ParB-like chromosome segregation protein Spo0J
MTNSFKNRIVGIGAEDPEQLLANPGNFRAHPGRQREALIALLDEVGFVAPVIVNRTTGHLVDGHLRVELALSRDEKAIPVSYVELTQEEERLVLATYDSVGDLAFSDKDRLRELLDSVSSNEAAVQMLLSSVATEAGLLAAVGTPEPKPDHSVTCPSCGEVFSPRK